MPHFPRVESLRGELKRTEIRAGTRYQLTTREFVLQRQQRTYRIAFENVLGLVECSDDEYRLNGPLYRTVEQGAGRPYKIVTTLMHLVSPRGVLEQERVSLYTRLSSSFARQFEILLSSGDRAAKG